MDSPPSRLRRKLGKSQVADAKVGAEVRVDTVGGAVCLEIGEVPVGNHLETHFPGFSTTQR